MRFSPVFGASHYANRRAAANRTFVRKLAPVAVWWTERRDAARGSRAQPFDSTQLPCRSKRNGMHRSRNVLRIPRRSQYLWRSAAPVRRSCAPAPGRCNPAAVRGLFFRRSVRDADRFITMKIAISLLAGCFLLAVVPQPPGAARRARAGGRCARAGGRDVPPITQARLARPTASPSRLGSSC